MVEKHLGILNSLKSKSGLFLASPTIETGYHKAWLRDNFYESISFETVQDWESVRGIYSSLLDIFKKYEKKIDKAIKQKPKYARQYIHARYDPITFNEFSGRWGNRQNDAVGCVLFKIGDLEKKGKSVLRDKKDREIVQKLVNYLASVEYWHDKDSGMWEENEEIHSSSIGACVAGLQMMKNISGIKVPKKLIEKGKSALNKLLPRESKTKSVDLALLSLIWPYSLTTKRQTETILKNVESRLLRERGVIRYEGDLKNVEPFSVRKKEKINCKGDGCPHREGEWTFGLSWLAIIYNKIGDEKKSEYFLEKVIADVYKNGKMPELYYADTGHPDANIPLGWSESLFITAICKIKKIKICK